MKKLFFPLLGAVLIAAAANAQPWLNTGKGQMKLQDVINNYHQNIQPYMAHDENSANNGAAEEENGDYQFDRWLWYWSQHIDPNGYLVPDSRNFAEWQAYTQKKNVANKISRTTSTDNSDWTFMGPNKFNLGDSSLIQQAPGIGRLSVVAFHPTDTNTMFVGSFGGGVWKTTDNGVTWKSLTDMLPSLSITDIVINPKNANTIYLCTGDGDGGSYYSIGILKSTNGGTTWDTTGLKWNTTDFHLTGNMIINPLDTNTLILATDTGIYRSSDAGKTWGVTVTGNFKQVLYDPADTNIVYATSYYIYYPTAKNAQIYRSADGGKTWNQVTNFNTTYRIALAVTPANPGIVKALASSAASATIYGLDGIYSSSDTGKTFTEIFTDSSCTKNLLSFYPDATGCGGQGFYDLTIAISPTDSNSVYIGGVNSWYSGNGGQSWSIFNQWAGYLPSIAQVHADKHCMRFSPLDPNRLVECNDGGVFETENPASSGTIYTNITNGLGIMAFYRIAVSPNSTLALGGAQDDGTKSVGGGGTLFSSVLGGDGMQCQFDQDTSYIYVSTEYGDIERCKYIGVSKLYMPESQISLNIPGHPTGAWVTPYVIHPYKKNTIIAGYDKIYASTNKGDSWSSLSPGLGAYGINELTITAKDSNDLTMCAAGQYSNHLFYTYDGTTWDSLITPYSPYTYISAAFIDPSDSSHFYTAFSGYDTVKVAEYKGGIWHSFSEGLPNVPVNCMQMDTSNRVLYVGTDLGVFYRTDSMTAWATFSKNMPVVRVNDLKINYVTGKIWAGTYGRSMWSSPKEIFSVKDTTHHINGVSIVPFAANSLTIYPNPNNGSFKIAVQNGISAQSVTISIIDALGRVVWQANSIANNSNIMAVNTGNVARGNYIVQVATEHGIIGRGKIVIE